MKKIFTGCLCLLTTVSYGQFAIIQDTDGYVNIRSSAAITANISDTLHNGRFVWYFDNAGEWVNIDYQKKGISKNGYIHKSRIIYLTTFDSIPLLKTEANKIIFSHDSLQVSLSFKKFNPARHKLTYKREDGVSYISRINNKVIWGTDGNIPKTQYASVIIKKGNTSSQLPLSAIENLYEPNPGFHECHYDKKKDILYISALNSDGAGSYALLWVIEKGKYKERITVIPF